MSIALSFVLLLNDNAIVHGSDFPRVGETCNVDSDCFKDFEVCKLTDDSNDANSELTQDDGSTKFGGK